MIQINQLKLRPGYTDEELNKKISSTLKVKPCDIREIIILKRSIDARKKPEVFYVLSCAVSVLNEDIVLKKSKSNNILRYDPVVYNFIPNGITKLEHRPLIVGAGPCGLFAALMLAEAGFCPLVIERGKSVDERTEDVNRFWETGILDTSSNVLFGEGGAGTFSDGKLNTLVKDKNGRNALVLDMFIRFGAPKKIKYDAKPHIGTDILVDVVKNIRKHIINLGGEFRFETKLTDITIDNARVKSIEVNNCEMIPCDILLLCIGHSARDTFKLLYDKKLHLEQKDFAVGFRVQHPQKLIDKALYTDDENILRQLPPSAYKLAYQGKDRGIYSFCMCPGGFVVNASSEEDHLCINGMSYSKRDGENANSAIVVTVNSKDFKSDHPLAGIEYQRSIESKAYILGNGKIPTEYYKDFKTDLGIDSCNDANRYPDTIVNPQFEGSFSMAKVTNIFPRDINELFVEGMEYFDRIIPGFAMDNALVSGVESRTSSPVRITRNELFESVNTFGIYPGGEGAGYAGGIMSAAMDGIKLYEAVSSKYVYEK